MSNVRRTTDLARYPEDHDYEVMFRGGMDTSEIARFLWISEAEVHRRVTIARCARLGLPSPYTSDAT